MQHELAHLDARRQNADLELAVLEAAAKRVARGLVESRA